MTSIFVFVSVRLKWMPLCYHRSMRVVVLGASGESGLEVVREGLARGIQITAGVRDTTKTEHIDHENFTSVKVDVFSEESLVSVFAGHDAVVSALSFPSDLAAPTFLLRIICFLF